MKRILVSALLLIAVTLVGCSEDDPFPEPGWYMDFHTERLWIDGDQVPTANGDNTTFLSGTYTWETPPAGSGNVTTLDALTDVNAGAPNDGDVLVWDDGAGEWIADNVTGGSGVTDHGALTGLADDDHTQYALDSDLTQYALDSDLSDHASDATDVHGIADTSALLDTSTALDDIADVAAAAPGDGQILTWNNGAGTWGPTTPGAASAWTTVFKTTYQQLTDTAVLADTSDLTITLQANSTYAIRLRVFYTTSSLAADFKYRTAFTGTTGFVRRLQTYAVANSYSSNYGTAGIGTTFDTSDRQLLSGAAGDGFVYEDIIVSVAQGGGGDFKFQFAQNTQTAGQTVQVYRGSYVEYRLVY